MGPSCLGRIFCQFCLSLSPPSTCFPFVLVVAFIILVIFYYKLFSLRKRRTCFVSFLFLCHCAVLEKSHLVCAEGSTEALPLSQCFWAPGRPCPTKLWLGAQNLIFLSWGRAMGHDLAALVLLQ